MIINPDQTNIHPKPGKEYSRKQPAFMRIIALLIAFASVLVIFLKILFF
jgi:hypothetical protein